MSQGESEMKSLPFHFDILVEQQSEGSVAHCLQLDIVAVAENQQQALGDIVDLIQTQLTTAIENDNLDSIFHPAPAEVWGKLYAIKQADKPMCLRENDMVRERTNEADFCYAQ